MVIKHWECATQRDDNIYLLVSLLRYMIHWQTPLLIKQFVYRCFCLCKINKAKSIKIEIQIYFTMERKKPQKGAHVMFFSILIIKAYERLRESAWSMQRLFQHILAGYCRSGRRATERFFMNFLHDFIEEIKRHAFIRAGTFSITRLFKKLLFCL